MKLLKFNPRRLIKTLDHGLKHRSPEILIGMGITGYIGATVLAVRGTKSALNHIEEMKKDLGKETLTKQETVKACWKDYIPTAILTAVSTACIFGAHSVHTRRHAALATAYAISESKLLTYKDKVEEVLDPETKGNVEAAVAQEYISRSEQKEQPVISTGHGEHICIDAYTGRRFTGDINFLKHVENELNRILLQDGSASLDDYYYELGIDSVKFSEYFGWDSRTSWVSMNLASTLLPDGTPCIVVDFKTDPKPNFYR